MHDTTILPLSTLRRQKRTSAVKGILIVVYKVVNLVLETILYSPSLLHFMVSLRIQTMK